MRTSDLIERVKNLSTVKESKVKTCGTCVFWKSDKTDSVERDHAAQGRALCQLQTKIDRPFLHHTTPACDSLKLVDIDTQIKRQRYLEGK